MMSSSLLWAVDVYGRVYSLSTAGGRWERSKDKVLELKRVTAVKQCCWGIGCDSQLYLNVNPSDVAIRYQEETYENQRWNPLDGFTDSMLPTDRWPWTDEAGLNPQPLHSFQLPSESWEWEGDWFVHDESCGRPSTNTGGWEYAVDFPASFSKDKKWNSCVRRRRWLRNRRYKALGLWSKIPLDRGWPPPQPFTDISCGGHLMGNSSKKHLYLWAVSQQGKVWFRSGIQHLRPEGCRWEEVAVPGEVAQMSCGPGDLLWTVLWDGQLLVRTGVSCEQPKGSSWTVVEPPKKNMGAALVSVGVYVVWAVTKDNKVWFRRGVNSHNPCGSRWINISGEMVSVSVGPNDQVWGIGSEDRTIYFRQGVTASQVTGTGWIPVHAQWDSSRPAEGHPSHDYRGRMTDSSQGSVLGLEESLGGPDCPIPKATIPKITSDSFISALVSDRECTIRPVGSKPLPTVPAEDQDQAQDQDQDQEADGGDEEVLSSLSEIPSKATGVDPWSNVDLEEEAKGKPPAGPGEAAAQRASVATYSLELPEVEERPPWAWVSGGGCVFTSDSRIGWLESSEDKTSSLSLAITPAHASAEKKKEASEEQIFEKSVSVTKGRLRWWRDWQPHQWEDVGIALEQARTERGRREDILYLYYKHNDEKKFLCTPMSDVTALVPKIRESLYCFAIYTSERTRQRWPLLLSTLTQQDLQQWLSLLGESCCHSKGIVGKPSEQALWAVTSKGDIMVHEPAPSLEAPTSSPACDHMFWYQVPGHLHTVECNSLGVVWGIGYDGTAWVYTGHRGGSVEGSGDHQRPLADVRSIFIYENQRWNPLAGYTDKGLPMDRHMWSDASGLRECTKASTKPPSPQWTWETDWAVDHSAPEGSDKEGWQYAADFTAAYTGNKTLKDFVRRRRWIRKCRIQLTGPWEEVPPIPLSDITILPCLAKSSMEQVPLWAISERGDILCRLGVTRDNPAGSSWLHVGTDQPFCSISIGGGHQVWAIARDNSVFYRGSVSAQNPAGDCWYHIPSPPKQNLKQLSVGRTSVYAVDENGNLWYRHGVTPSYPQGTVWELISNNVSKVTVGPLDQVWIIAEKVPGCPSESPGTVCHRVGVQPMQPKGQSWDFGIGGGWMYLSVRGNALEAQRAPARSPQPPRAQRQVNGNIIAC
ncbi:tectonin beta-propeller repeat-containing protein 1 isoform X2 [Clupea harengus]|uniref:Tectonin beta-propeller repeat-containing protein 1 isoform X2 n=1 Tax=Clupea harengus TaxID=7950 RepID=A0A6P3VUV5_CLUHA|nr:tectonin beta-propeller repeat-containing protein 1 isoform X2 [Clupea harengus]